MPPATRRFFTTPHYDGYPAILVNLKKVKRAVLKEMVVESWRRKAPLKLLREFDARPVTWDV